MKLAIIGTGMIVPVALEAIQQVESITVTSIFARPQSIEKGKELAIQFSIPTVYTDYENYYKPMNVIRFILPILTLSIMNTPNKL